MKTTIKLGKLEIKELGLNLENIELTQEYSIGEATKAINFGKRFVEEVIDELGKALEEYK